MSAVPISPSHLAWRLAASLLGSYCFVWGFTTFGITLGVAIGLTYQDAQTLLYLLAFLVFLVCFCWAFIARRLMLVWLVFVGGGSAMTVAAWHLMSALLSH